MTSAREFTVGFSGKIGDEARKIRKNGSGRREGSAILKINKEKNPKTPLFALWIKKNSVDDYLLGKKSKLDEISPAEPFEEHMIALRSIFDSPEQAHWRTKTI